MTDEEFQLLKMIRNGEDPNIPRAPHPQRLQAARYVDAAMARAWIERTSTYVLTPRGRDAFEHEEAMRRARLGPQTPGGAAVVVHGAAPPHANLQSMADHLAAHCQLHVDALPHGRINFVVIVHAGDPLQILGAPAWAYAEAGNISREDRRELLRAQLAVLDSEDELQRAGAAAGQPATAARALPTGPRGFGGAKPGLDPTPPGAWCGICRGMQQVIDPQNPLGTLPCPNCCPEEPTP